MKNLNGSLQTLLRRGASALAVLSMTAGVALAGPPAGVNDGNTKTPIKHVIIIVGENRSFDHLFGTYVSPSGDAVRNILSEGVITAAGAPGPNFAMGEQRKGKFLTSYGISVPAGRVYSTLPAPNTGAASMAQSFSAPPFPPLSTPFPGTPYTVGQVLYSIEPGLTYPQLTLLTTGATGLAAGSIDTRIPNATALPSGPFPLGTGATYDSYGADSVHRFYQMFQQMDCSVVHATKTNPSGCRNDLFPFVETTVGVGSSGAARPSGFTDETTGEGSISMGFYNVQQGDAPYLKSLADTYTLLDNYHQPAKGGTGLNSLYLGFADALWYSDGAGNPATPPINEIENPNPQPGTNNYYIQDGYSGGSYSNCSDTTQPGVQPIVDYLTALGVSPNCDAGHYYLLNNYNPGYLGNGVPLPLTVSPYTIPPSPVRSIADSLNAAQISWGYYGEGWSTFVSNPTSPFDLYCNICNPFLYQTSIMTGTDPNTGIPYRQQNLFDLPTLYSDIASGSLPAVTYVKPNGLNDGHPQTSKLSIYEAFVQNIITAVKANPALWADTAILVTVDEGGGRWDSGYTQQLDYFGDGPRIPMIVVSPYSTGGHVSHVYSDHASVPKFIEANWGLSPITARSRDNLPNPVTQKSNPYVPTNGPSISDLVSVFSFPPAAAP